MTDTAPPKGYPYLWTPSSKEPLSEFLEKNKPNSIRNDAKNTKPYVWVATSDPHESALASEVVEEAKAIVKDVETKVAEIQANADIPVRANKKKGLKSKKEAREEIQTQASADLKELALKRGAIGGKWMAFVNIFQVDPLFARLAESLVSGELSHTKASQVRVGTLHAGAENDTTVSTHNLEVFLPDIFDETAAREVMKVLLRHHGLKLSGAKPDLYTAIGLNSKHPSGIPSTIWKGTGGPGSLLTADEIQELRSAYYAEQGRGNTAEPDGTESKSKKGPVVAKNRKTAEEDNPFGSDEEEEAPKPKRSSPGKGGSKKTSRKRPAGESDSEDEPPKKVAKPNARAAPAKAPARRKVTAAKKTADSDSE
ncbi:hypothetical protein M408DRAFT_330350 [Serendipita vermifera MAFF 305830]|uniref:Uncharacterized protein n=1 Tax=Serendipita vermifera MAFF 305830 TaxID=933852 RepID=A0A0C2WL05_SERVB|nr:hypothetical protein M408DRAFT_330350 [Serendipita vermifera MAFF 305830]